MEWILFMFVLNLVGWTVWMTFLALSDNRSPETFALHTVVWWSIFVVCCFIRFMVGG